MKVIDKKIKKESKIPYKFDTASKEIGKLFEKAGITKKVKLSELDISYAYDDSSVLKIRKGSINLSKSCKT